jgi:serine/threonine protein kinase
VSEGEILMERCGTPAYIAPEILRELGYKGTAADVWSAGVVLYTMLYGNFPFNADTVEELERLVLIGNYNLPLDTSMDGRDLLARILDPDPSTRITIPEIYLHSWMKDIDYTCICYIIFSKFIHRRGISCY